MRDLIDAIYLLCSITIVGHIMIVASILLCSYYTRELGNVLAKQGAEGAGPIDDHIKTGHQPITNPTTQPNNTVPWPDPEQFAQLAKPPKPAGGFGTQINADSSNS